MTDLHGDLRAPSMLRNNIGALLYGRKLTQVDLAQWMRRDKSWINKFLNGTREVQLKDLDRIADFFGLAPYQLFQPGISSVTERRRAPSDRRVTHDRRISHAQRQLLTVAQELRKGQRRTKIDLS